MVESPVHSPVPASSSPMTPAHGVPGTPAAESPDDPAAPTPLAPAHSGRAPPSVARTLLQPPAVVKQPEAKSVSSKPSSAKAPVNIAASAGRVTQVCQPPEQHSEHAVLCSLINEYW